MFKFYIEKKTIINILLEVKNKNKNEISIYTETPFKNYSNLIEIRSTKILKNKSTLFYDKILNLIDILEDKNYTNEKKEEVWMLFISAIEQESENIKFENEKYNFYNIKKSIIKIIDFLNYNKNPDLKQLEDMINWYLFQFIQYNLTIFKKTEGNKDKIQTINEISEILYHHREKKQFIIAKNRQQLSSMINQNHDINFTKNNIFLQEKSISYAERYKVIIMGFSASAAMLGLYSLILYIEQQYSKITLPLLSLITIGYGIREVFKESLKNKLSKMIKKNMCKNKSFIFYGDKKNILAKQWVRLSTSKESPTNHSIDLLSCKNKYGALRYHSFTKLYHSRIPFHFDGIEEKISIDLTKYIETLSVNTKKIYLFEKQYENQKKVMPYYNFYITIKNSESFTLLSFKIKNDRIIELKIADTSKECKASKSISNDPVKLI